MWLTILTTVGQLLAKFWKPIAAAIFGWREAKRHEQRKDQRNATRIEKAADAARAAPGGDPVERVRRHGKLRD